MMDRWNTVLNVFTVKMIDTNKIKELRLEPTLKKLNIYVVKLFMNIYGVWLGGHLGCTFYQTTYKWPLIVSILFM